RSRRPSAPGRWSRCRRRSPGSRQSPRSWCLLVLSGEMVLFDVMVLRRNRAHLRMIIRPAQERTFLLLGHMERTMVTALGDCRARETLDRIGDKWSLYLITLLGDGTKRFSELKREAEGISQRMLAVTLRGLERDGLVTRTMYPVMPPRVEY